jgi:hypothetical protein
MQIFGVPYIVSEIPSKSNNFKGTKIRRMEEEGRIENVKNRKIMNKKFYWKSRGTKSFVIRSFRDKKRIEVDFKEMKGCELISLLRINFSIEFMAV